MKKTILKFLVITLFVQAQGLSAFAQQADISPESQFSPTDLIDMDAIERAFVKGEMSEDKYQYYSDLVESGGDIERVTIPAEPDPLTPEEQVLMNDNQIQDIGGATTIEELQKQAQKKVTGYGQWGFHFVYISNDGKIRKDLTAYNKNVKIRPASTLKIFSSNLAYDKGTYSSANLGVLLQKSRNGMADLALKSVANKSSYRVSEDSDPRVQYLLNPKLANYKMYDSTERKSQIIDNLILRGSALMIKEYAGLEDSSKFHPVNGSGLQQTDKDTDLQTNTVTPRLETALLERILSNRKKYDRFKMLLTSPGRPGGTLFNTFQQGRKLAKIYAKTGTLGNGKALTGYAQTEKGVIVFSIIGDNLRGVSVKGALKDIIETVVYNHLAYVKSKGL